MPMLVDGYNVLWHPMPVTLAGLDEAGLAQLLSRGAFARDRVTIVFDGQPKGIDASEAAAARATVLFSGPGKSADDMIIDRIAADSAPRRLVVVSDDREIQKAARRRRCAAWPSDWLIQAMAREAERSGQRSIDNAAAAAGGGGANAGPSPDTARQSGTQLSDADLAALTDAAEAEHRRLEAKQAKSGALSRDEVDRWLDAFGIDENGRPTDEQQSG